MTEADLLRAYGLVLRPASGSAPEPTGPTHPPVDMSGRVTAASVRERFRASVAAESPGARAAGREALPMGAPEEE